jgi:YjbE family integral membrane protein
MESFFADMAALLQVILIDLALAGDNAIAVGLAASSLRREDQRRAIFWGVLLALVLRIGFALVTVQLLSVKGILFVGGAALVWVAWRMWKDLNTHGADGGGAPQPALKIATPAAAPAGGGGALAAPPTFARALMTIVIADVSMSLDNVLAVAGVSRHAPTIMAFGLVLSVVLMGVAASVIARVIERYRWIAVVGIVVILVAAVRMMWEDLDVWFPSYVPDLPGWLSPQAAD